MTLGLQAGAVNEDSSIRVEAGKGEADVVVDEADLGGRDAGVLQLHCGALLAAEDHDGGAFDADGAGAAFDGFEGVFDLEDVAVGTVGWWWGLVVLLLLGGYLSMRGGGGGGT